MKYIELIRKKLSKTPIFTIRDVKLILKKKGANEKYSNLLIHNLLKKGEIYRITRGIYTFKNEIEVVGFAFSPFYYGLQEALSLRNLWEQETNPVVITKRKVRKGIRTIMDRNIIVRTINKKMFFGFEMIKYYDFWIPVSDVEKILIDFIYFREPLDKETLKEMKKRIRKKVMENYLKRVPNYLRKRVRKVLRK